MYPQGLVGARHSATRTASIVCAAHAYVGAGRLRPHPRAGRPGSTAAGGELQDVRVERAQAAGTQRPAIGGWARPSCKTFALLQLRTTDIHSKALFSSGMREAQDAAALCWH